MKLDPLLAERAKQRQKDHGGTAPGKKKSLRAMLPEVIKSKTNVTTRKELAKIAKVSDGTMQKAKVIVAKAPEEVKEKLRNDGTLTPTQLTDDHRPAFRTARPRLRAFFMNQAMTESSNDCFHGFVLREGNSSFNIE
ncbi:MAG: hypothetical protein AAB288_02365 [Acidobacteriota bacterium]